MSDTDVVDNDLNNNLIDDHEEATIGMDEIDNFDFDRAMKLMSIMEKVAGVAPKSMAISGLAAAALNEMNEEAKDIAKRRAEAFSKAEADARNKAYDEQRAREADEAEARDNAADANRRVQQDAEDDAGVNTQPRRPTPRPAPAPTDNSPRRL